jgi:flavin-dependent dehydrogenase
VDKAQKVMYIDVCIIGGGIAGNYLALLLAQRKIHCCVIEEHLELGKPFQCAGIMSQKLMKVAPFPSNLILNRVKRAQIIAPNHSEIFMAGKESPVVIDRVGFDAYFGNQALQAGAKYFLGERYLQHKALKDGRVWIQTNKHIIIAHLIVGADGPFSRVAAQFGIKNKVIPAYQVRAKYEYDLNSTMMYFQPRWKELFGYVVPEGVSGICRIGIAASYHPKEAMQQFLTFLKVNPANIIDEQGGVLPFGFPRKIAFRNTVLLGDSAMMVKATTGGGVVMNLTAAKILADAVQKAMEKQDFSENFLVKNYQRPIKRTIGIDLKVHYFIRMLLMRLKPYDFNHFFKLYHKSDFKAIIQQYADMDFPVKLFQKLIVNKYFIRYLVHIAFRNWRLIPQYLHDIAL